MQTEKLMLGLMMSFTLSGSQQFQKKEKQFWSNSLDHLDTLHSNNRFQTILIQI